MSKRRTILLKAGVIIFLLTVFFLGMVNSPKMAKRVIPETFWGGQTYSSHRQLVYSERTATMVNATMAYIDELRQQPETLRRLGITLEQLNTAEGKEIARMELAKEKMRFMTYKFERMQREYNKVMERKQQ
ncbi:hypothetical protein [Oceanidesulfovibrio marinus]|uniref:Uncharacterized protein n=1 Tax=Oceanidesulfovibrio marinus TaxID=370038 RepID=A0A6P1ZL57_9BACT|nr:hypothetical protein [Oceanidesulfovibrio marinus]QJT09049.1 hypothetical protein E8L03_08945 [Oceanidesulfovibrio marinus]TVM36523.1 hypothetical protein DQK91_00945 [Oceanidesulfovibrio marinus]